MTSEPLKKQQCIMNWYRKRREYADRYHYANMHNYYALTYAAED